MSTKIRVYIATKTSSKLIRDTKKADKNNELPNWEEILNSPDAQGTTSYKGLKL